MIKTKVTAIKAGQYVINLGPVEETEAFDSYKLIRLKIPDNLSLSAAIFWYRSNMMLYIATNDEEKQQG